MKLHHDPDKSGHDDPATTLSLVNVDESMNYFSVHWERNATNDEQHPSVENGCGNGACEVYDEDTCLCETTVSETQAVVAKIAYRPGDQDYIVFDMAFRM